MLSEDQIRDEMDAVAVKLGNVAETIAQIEAVHGSDPEDPGAAQRYREATVSRPRLQARYDQLEAELREAPMRERERQKAEVLMRARMGYVESAFGGAPAIRRGGPAFWRQGEDAYDTDLDLVHAGRVDPAELIDRARYAVEQSPKYLVDDPVKHQAITVLEDETNPSRLEIARHMLLTGSDAYRAELSEFIRSQGTVKGPHILRANALNPDSAGGALVNFQLDPTILLSNLGVTGSIRSMATVIQTSQNEWRGVTSDGVTAGWLAEGSPASDNSPAFSQDPIVAHKAFAYIEATYELMADSTFESQLGRLIADAAHRLNEEAFATGDGSGKPRGIVHRLVATTASRVAAAGAGTIAVADIFSMSDAASPRHGGSSTWLANKQVLNRIRQFSTNTGNGGSFWTDLGPATPSLLLGQPVVEASSMDRIVGTTSSILVLADLKNFYIVDRLGTTLVFDRMVRDTTTGMPIGAGAWAAYWRVGSDFRAPEAAGRVMRAHTTTSGWV